jgi:hypothetical protein
LEPDYFAVAAFLQKVEDCIALSFRFNRSRSDLTNLKFSLQNKREAPCGRPKQFSYILISNIVKMTPIPAISRRHGIAWSSEPMIEPTSTLVLSSPSGLFVDVRIILKEPLAGVPSNPRTLPHVLTGPRPFQPNSEFKALEWGIAGKASYESTTTSVGESKRTGQWTHWIDSRTVQPALDSGDIEPREDGSALETGTMEHPETGVMTPYSEVWVHETVGVAPQEKSARKRAKGTYLVVQRDDESRGIRGRIAWAGKYCQGVVREGEKVVVERWEFDNSTHGGIGEWVRTWRTGDGPLLPCGWVVKEAEEMRKGTVLNMPDLEGNGGEWAVVETDFE